MKPYQHEQTKQASKEDGTKNAGHNPCLDIPVTLGKECLPRRGKGDFPLLTFGELSGMADYSTEYPGRVSSLPRLTTTQ